MDTLSGSVEIITYQNPENGYTILRLKPDVSLKQYTDHFGNVTVVGNLPDCNLGEHLSLQGEWKKHSEFGMQFSVTQCQTNYPSTLEGLRRYLGSGLIKGIGPRLADRIVDTFGLETIDILDNHPARLREVPDFGAKRSLMVVAAWDEQRNIKQVMLFLHSKNISTSLAVKIYKQYGDQSLTVIQSDPYRLARDIHGVGFITADRLAQSLGLAVDNPSRIEAGLIYILNEAASSGHVYLPQSKLFELTADLLKVDADLLPVGLERLTKGDRIVLQVVEGQTAVYLTAFNYFEQHAADKIAHLIHPSESRLAGIQQIFSLFNNNLTDEQFQAVKQSFESPVSILTGGPGTGKTTTLKVLIDVLELNRKKVALASPTGRAAKRLAESTGHPASTIHRLLGYIPGGGFNHCEENPLNVDMLVIDESSMLDLALTHYLLSAVSPGTHVLFVGDVDQLPSVGAGNILKDLIACQHIPVTRLTQIFRQASDSQIITNAHAINYGETPRFQSDNHDFFLFPATSAEEAARWVVDVVCTRIPKKFGFDPVSQIQVLTPIHRSPAGVISLNQQLQSALNPPTSSKPEKSLFGQVFRINDRVMQVQNNYDKEVFNGDIGKVSAINFEDHTLTVAFDDRQVTYDWLDVDQLTLAYAITIHKSQGSEFPAVVIPLVMQHYHMLQRNLLYTGITRARELCVLVGDQKAIQMAVKNNQAQKRYSNFSQRICLALPGNALPLL
ncbi:MAG TPA: ATP-dependent RecD-like DNA helicase [Anaerolineaceae bacterium]|nr:ATP-dependent RecD-like DNA helicase [Anaerolineaceae bacterium]HPN51714.1 ATP-dependent RecD-like DNA helicase [Anaerolineaceae bacterium]